jgi:hypothetical protein
VSALDDFDICKAYAEQVFFSVDNRMASAYLSRLKQDFRW